MAHVFYGLARVRLHDEEELEEQPPLSAPTQINEDTRRLFFELSEEIRSDAERVTEENFLPEPYVSAHFLNHVLATPAQYGQLLSLYHLSLTHPKNPSKIPLTEIQARKCHESYIEETRTSRWLGWRAWAVLTASSVVFACVPAFITATRFAEDEGGNMTTQIVLTSIVSFVSLMLFGAYGLLWTGVYPNQFSIKANDKQNCLISLRSFFENMAHLLVDLSYCRQPLAQSLAADIDCEYIRSMLSAHTHERDIDELTSVHLLQQAVIYVREGHLPTNPTLALHVRALPRQPQ